MPSHAPGRAKRFALVLLLFLSGPLSIARPPNRQASRPSDRRIAGLPDRLVSGLLPALFEAEQRTADAAYRPRRTDTGYRLSNGTQHFDVTFDAGGVWLTAAQQADQSLTLGLTGIGGVWRQDGGRIARDRDVDGLRVTEWYLNAPRGLEQGFTIQGSGDGGQGSGDGGQGSAADELRLAIETGAKVSVSAAGALLSTDSGFQLTYGGVDAWDATGRRVPVRLDAAAGTLSLVVTPGDATYPITIDPIVQQAQLTASDGAANGKFGGAVAVDGDTAIVGAGIQGGGKAYVFVRSGTTWSQQQELTESSTWYYGTSVAVSGNTAVIGSLTGAAYVYVRSGTTWSRQQTITGGGAFSGGSFGGAVALSGDTAVIGQIGDTVNGITSAGSAYVYVRSGTTWSQQARLTASDYEQWDYFGTSVAISGNTVVIGAPQLFFHVEPRPGKAYVFVRSGTVWSQQQKLTATDGVTVDWFGAGVAVSGDTALIGAPQHDVGSSTNQGAAYVFTRSNGSSGPTWTQQQELTASDGAALDLFGYFVALDGTNAVVPAMRKTVGGNAQQGAVYHFVQGGSTWTQDAKLTASDGAAGDAFGGF